MTDRAASVAAFGHWLDPMLKCQDDLDRYAKVIAETEPEVIVETGTRSGASARWFLNRPGIREVITVDVLNRDDVEVHHPDRRLTRLAGSSTDPDVVESVRDLIAGRRVMVVLDSDHSRDHVIAEIRTYGSLVTPGCYLVVEDAIIDWLDARTIAEHAMADQVGNPMQAIEATLVRDDRFVADQEIELLSSVSMFPSGWWRRR